MRQLSFARRAANHEAGCASTTNLGLESHYTDDILAQRQAASNNRDGRILRRAPHNQHIETWMGEPVCQALWPNLQQKLPALVRFRCNEPLSKLGKKMNYRHFGLADHRIAGRHYLDCVCGLPLRGGSLKQIGAHLSPVNAELLFNEDGGIAIHFTMTVLETTPCRTGDANFFSNLIGGELAGSTILTQDDLGCHFLSHDT
jgi:hypothetical protein